MASTTSSIQRSVQDGINILQKSKPRKDVPRSVMPNLATIQLLLHLYVTGDDWEVTSQTPQAQRNAYTFLRTQGMVDSDNSPTKKGRVWIEALEKLPLPEEVTTYRIPTYTLNDNPDAD
jgi:hypothetical protein